MSKFNFDPASLVIVEAINPVKAAKPRIAKAKPRFTAKVTDKGIRFYISAELAELLSLGMGENGLNVLADNPEREGFDPAVVALQTVPEDGAQLLAKAESRKSRNFAAHALAAPLLAQGLIGTALGEYNFDLELFDGETDLYGVIVDEREGISHKLETVGDTTVLDTEAIIGNPKEEDCFEDMQEACINHEEENPLPEEEALTPEVD